MEVKGTVYAIGSTTSKDHNGKTYKERQIVIQVDEQYNGQTYSQYIPILGKRDTIIGFMDSLKVGQSVTAHCNLRGVKYMKDNVERFFGSIEVYKIDATPVSDDTPTTNAMAGNTGTVSDLPF
jgi:hypothetical protein